MMTFREKVDKILGNVLIIIMAVMVVNVLWQVISRYLVGIPSSFTDELARYLMIWIGVLGAAYISGKNMHVAIDLVQSKASEPVRKRLKIIIYFIIIIFVFGAFVVGGIRLVYVTYILEQYSPALQIPLALVYLILPISGIIIIYYKISDLLNQ
jgi:TRAP-type C4-dicarboxylate transport system permease small subunit